MEPFVTVARQQHGYCCGSTAAPSERGAKNRDMRNSIMVVLPYHSNLFGIVQSFYRGMLRTATVKVSRHLQF